MSGPRDLVRRAILESAILAELTEAAGETRQELRQAMRPGERLEDDELGLVLVTKPKPPSMQVVDWPSFTRWVEDQAPDAIITVTSTKVAPSVVAAILKAGEWTDPDTGEVLTPDGIGLVQGTPQLRVNPNGAAADVARGVLGALPALEIEHG